MELISLHLFVPLFSPVNINGVGGLLLGDQYTLCSFG